MAEVATMEIAVTITSVKGESWTIEGKMFVARKPKGFRQSFNEEMACAHRDVSVCPECANKYANIVEVAGTHYWVRDYAEWRELVGELCAIQAEYA